MKRFAYEVNDVIKIDITVGETCHSYLSNLSANSISFTKESPVAQKTSYLYVYIQDQELRYTVQVGTAKMDQN